MNKKVSFLQIDSSQAGQKLIAFLQRNLRNQSTGIPLPGTLFHRLIRSGQIRVNKGRIKPNYILQTGDELRLPPLDRVSLPANDSPSESASTEQSSTISGCLQKKGSILEVNAETDDYLVLNKPAGLPVHGGTGHTQSVIGYVMDCWQETGFTPTLAHRLDKDTSGVLLIAKTYSFLRLVQDAFKDGSSQKFYFAWVIGKWPHSECITLEDRLLKKADAKGAEKVSVSTPSPNQAKEGAFCQSRITPLKEQEGFTLLQVELLTGRTHQIRVQLASRGYPIIGDRKYGGPACKQGMLLHCYSFSLPASSLEFKVLPSWQGNFAAY